ncbi:hypothetical protein RUMGNA_01606 [Mediterraneibacter gnavus ATCC 29149]|uniref:Uncharacterized protein n=1 Tax=Mediterraneibacter gnavus (strain ATCC 29149 / DSM 114966 / JCM 6515 / VPI C7-9) TaxID=411470 RepID=A7B229_MEDG7|nr:hypothetical protein RUMGNA_01606 [Mediterraneibacter gnavus ATCC 29149]
MYFLLYKTGTKDWLLPDLPCLFHFFKPAIYIYCCK